MRRLAKVQAFNPNPFSSILAGSRQDHFPGAVWRGPTCEYREQDHRRPLLRSIEASLAVVQTPRVTARA